MKTTIRALQGFFAICLLAGVQNATAASLGLTPGPYDFQLDSTTGTANINYDSGSGQLTITSLIGNFTEGSGAPSDIVDSSQIFDVDYNPAYLELFTLTANFSTIDGSFLSGSFQLDGVVRDSTSPLIINHTGQGDADGLLSGVLSQFGISGTTDDSGFIEFTFNNGDGKIADLYGTGGGMILSFNLGSQFTDAGNSFENDFYLQDWSTTTLAAGDVWVPVPAAAWLFISGLLGMIGVARSNTRTRKETV